MVLHSGCSLQGMADKVRLTGVWLTWCGFHVVVMRYDSQGMAFVGLHCVTSMVGFTGCCRRSLQGAAYMVHIAGHGLQGAADIVEISWWGLQVVVDSMSLAGCDSQVVNPPFFIVFFIYN